VGKDTKMHELLIFFSTLGGIFMFGFPGLFIGPVIASLFVSIWEIYGVEFADVLPDVDEVLRDQPVGPMGPDGLASDSSPDPDIATAGPSAEDPMPTEPGSKPPDAA
jgi:hypothetical protein